MCEVNLVPFMCTENNAARVKKKKEKKKKTYLQLTVTFTVLVSGEAMSFKALHS